MWERKFALTITLLLLLATATGVYVRASGAGTSCPDWPTCFGQWWIGDTLSEEAREQFPGMLFDAVRAKSQMGHRYLAILLGSLVVVWAGFAGGRSLIRRLLGWHGLLVALLAAQIALGAGLVASHLRPELVVMHLLVATLMVAVAFRIYLSSYPSLTQFLPAPGLLRYARLCGWVVVLQIALGGWVSANDATLACPDFPMCQGEWWPSADYSGAFSVWRHWGAALGEWQMLDENARMAIHWIHRIGAAVTFLVLFFLGISISSNPKIPHLSKVGLILNFLLLVQITLGLATVIKQAPIALVVAHSLTAILLFVAVTTIVFFLQNIPTALAPAEQSAEPRVSLVPEAGVGMGGAPLVEVPPPRPETLYDRLKRGLGKTRQGLTGLLASLPLGKQPLDESLLEQLETQLLMADVGVEATQQILDHLQDKLKQQGDGAEADVVVALRQTLHEILAPCSQTLKVDSNHKPFVILVVGVNGVGKTTTIGKLAYRFKQQGMRVMLAAGDTFRAAAVEQLKVWGERNGVPVIAQETGADSASVVYDALQSAQAKGIDVLIADTAGRLHTKSNLMEELGKIKRILAKLDPTAPHEVLLVVDATTGQNALVQAEQFNQAVGVTGIALTKLDGTAKGGVIFALAKRFGIPIRFIGVGEGMEDLQEFDAKAFVDALFVDQQPVVH